MITIPLTQTPVSASMGGAFSNDIVQMIIYAGPMVKLVMLILLMFSITSWAIIFMKFRLFRKAARETSIFLDVFQEGRGLNEIYTECKNFSFSPVALLFRAGYSELRRIRRIQTSMNPEENRDAVGSDDPSHSQRTTMDNLERSLKKSTIDQMSRLEKALSFLATTGNTAPFIGLFGTVWGIMNSFRGIGLKGSANLAVVAPGISEALIATAAGLAAAIPAVVAFNYFIHRSWALRSEMDVFTSDFLSMVERQFFKKHIVTITQEQRNG